MMGVVCVGGRASSGLDSGIRVTDGGLLRCSSSPVSAHPTIRMPHNTPPATYVVSALPPAGVIEPPE